MDQVSPFISGPAGIKEGNLLLAASKENLLTICDHIAYRFIRSGDIFSIDSKWLLEASPGVVKKYGKIDTSINERDQQGNYIKRNKVTRGWSYLFSGTLHRFFYREFDLFVNKNSLINGDYHWWLEDSEQNIIDLTEEQYHLNDIYDCRTNGVKHEPLKEALALKTRDLAFTVANDLFREGVDIKKILVTGYEYFSESKSIKKT